MNELVKVWVTYSTYLCPSHANELENILYGWGAEMDKSSAISTDVFTCERCKVDPPQRNITRDISGMDFWIPVLTPMMTATIH